MSINATKPLGFGVIGCGVISSNHCNAINEVKDAQLVAVCDVDPAKAKKIGEKFNVPYYTDLNNFLEHPNLAAVSVCVPSGYHAAVGIQAAKAGKHVLVEKPIEVTVEAATSLIEACEQADVKLGVISQHRFAPDVIRVKQAIENGELGILVLGEASIKWYRTQEYYDSGDWRGTKALDGGGALMNQGIHYIDLLQWLMGKVVSVKAATITRTHQIEVEDVGVAILHFANGALGTIRGSTSCYPGLPERLELHGADGTAIIEKDILKTFLVRSELGTVGNYGMADKLSQAELEQTMASGGASNPSAIGDSSHTAQVADFVAAIRDKRLPAISGREALQPLEIILAIYQSSAENREVYLLSAGENQPG